LPTTSTSKSNDNCHCAGILIFCSAFFIFKYVPEIENETDCSLFVLLNTTGCKTTLSSIESIFGRFGFINRARVVCIFLVETQTFVSGVFTKDSITRVVRLSGNASAVIVAIHLESVVMFAFRYAVSLNIHLFFLLFHHFIEPPSHHFDQFDVSLISSFSTNVLSDSDVSVHRYLFIS
jgi:hypothetical protein